MRIEQIYKWLVKTLEQNQIISEEEVYEKLNSDEVNHALLFLDYLVKQKKISAKIQGNTKIYYLDDLDKIKSTIPKSDVMINDVIGNDKLVINFPLSLAEELNSLRKKYVSVDIINLIDAFKLLLRVAEKEVCLILPFFESSGLSYLIDDFSVVATKGVSIKIITRGILEIERDGFPFISKIRAFRKLISIYNDNKTNPETRIQIREYSSRITNHSSTHSLHYEGIHQKIIVVDNKYSYVGSGEIREASFLTNGEAGIIQLGENALFWRDFFNVFWQEAKIIENDFFENFLRF